MRFLKGKSVWALEYYNNRVVTTPLFTASEYEQKVHIDMSKEDSPRKVEIHITYNRNFPAPKKLSVSAIQYTMNPFDVELKYGKESSIKPFKSIKMDGLRTLVEFDENINEIVFVITNEKNIRKAADIKFSVNYIEF